MEHTIHTNKILFYILLVRLFLGRTHLVELSSYNVFLIE